MHSTDCDPKQQDDVSLGEKVTGIDIFSPMGVASVPPRRLRATPRLGKRILAPARTHPDNGYRWYDPTQLEQARLVALLRQVGLPLEGVRQMLGADSEDAVALVRRYWERAEAEHRARAGLMSYLVNRLEGRSPILYEVATRQMPDRPVPCLRRHVGSEREVWDLGKQSLAYFRDRPRPLLPGRQGARSWSTTARSAPIATDPSSSTGRSRPRKPQLPPAATPSSSCARRPPTKKQSYTSAPTKRTPPSG